VPHTERRPVGPPAGYYGPYAYPGYYGGYANRATSPNWQRCFRATTLAIAALILTAATPLVITVALGASDAVSALRWLAVAGPLLVALAAREQRARGFRAPLFLWQGRRWSRWGNFDARVQRSGRTAS
jgi:hypothetical protein